MESAVPQRLEQRKAPIQARSEATVEAIQEAAIQVLLADGLGRLTTTRVAGRAGVSVGTLYQYFPNKEALLFAILLRHFEAMAEAFERLGTSGDKRRLADVADCIADAYVAVKTARPDATRALYRVAGAIDQVRLPLGIFRRQEAAVVRLLESSTDASFSDPARAAFTLLSALAGLARASFGALVSESPVLDRLGEEARLLSRAYLKAVADMAASEAETSPGSASWSPVSRECRSNSQAYVATMSAGPRALP